MKTSRTEGSPIAQPTAGRRITRRWEVSRRALLRGGLLAGVAVLTDALAGSAQAPPQQSGRPGGGGALSAPVSLAQAVGIAEKHTGGRARKAEMERERGVHVYEIKTVSKDTSAKVHVDPTSGSVLRVGTPWLSGVLDRDDQRKDQAAFAQLAASSMSLVGAIEMAEKAIGGRAVEAALKSRYGSMLFEASVVKDWTTHKVLVDPATAKVVTSPAHGKHEDDDD